ncbi:FKBP-type peptidyl-prolyl cis-trans isomerase [Nonomuraea sp. NPDC050790]|uniref:FKBP-type peptidyl-prolyl cis-trans isomerase n=1 Tax=Nonomuraea sp. NPDC050790 TaxID=3364371 RepID=UPI0037B51FF0
MRLIWFAAVLLAASCGLATPTPSVSGAFGTRPVISLPTGPPDPEPRVTVLWEGGGRVTRPGDVVVTDVEVRRWEGNQPYLNTYDTRQPATVLPGDGQAPKAWREALVGHAAGSRVMLVGPAGDGALPKDGLAGGGALPKDGLAGGGALPKSGLVGGGVLSGVAPPLPGGGETLVVVFDILGGYPADARLLGKGVPDLPADLQASGPSRTLIDGSGPMVERGAKIVVQYVGARWPTRTVFDSSHRRGGPRGFTLVPGAVPPGWVEALTGKAVGSRVAVTVPATATKGFTATTGGIGVPGGGPLLYVVDIIDTI